MSFCPQTDANREYPVHSPTVLQTMLSNGKLRMFQDSGERRLITLLRLVT